MKLVNFSIFAVLAVLFISVQSFDQKQCKCEPNVWKKDVNSKQIVTANRPAWLATIHSKLTINKNLTVCAATILNEQWLLTAASCVPNPANESIEDMQVEIPESNKWLDVQEVLLHPEYERTDGLTPSLGLEARNNIALVRVQQKISFDGLNKPACLFEQPRSMYTGPLHFAVYGSKTPVEVLIATKLGRPLKHKLIQNFNPYPYLVEGGGFDEVSKKRKPGEPDCTGDLCVSSKSSATSVCLSDVGTPVHWTEGKKEYVVGVATIPRYKKEHLQSVTLCTNEVRATRVHLYLDWISKVLKSEYCH